MKKSGIRSVVAIGIGTALFFALSYVAIPVGFLPNTSIQTRAAFLAFMSAIFGPVSGAAIGLIGHAIADAGQYGGIWWSWVFPEAVIGIVIGIFASKYKIEEGGFGLKEIITFNISQILANVIAWILIAPALDIIIYAEPANKVFAQGAVSAIANVISIGIIGTLLGVAYSRVKSKSSSLSMED
jgi:energy-coupling factor transport system substrate-specific component